MATPAVNRVTVIGGGSSGMMAAVSAARRGAAAVLLEQKDRVGRKLLATGNGRCNLTNLDGSLSRFHGGDRAFIAAVLARFSASSAVDFFEALGVACEDEGGGRIYPRPRQASAVLDCLRWELERLQVDVRTGYEVKAIERRGTGFALSLAAGGELPAQHVILACGGMAGPQFGSDGSGLRLAAALGHRVVDPVATLVPLRLRADFLRKLKGVNFTGHGEVRCLDEVLRGETGEFLFTDSGISGPPVLQLSRSASVALKQGRAPRIVLDLFPDSSLEGLDSALEVRFRRQGRKTLTDGLVGLLNKRLIPIVLSEAGIDYQAIPCAEMTDAARNALARLLKGWSLEISGTMPWPEAHVTAGGVDLRDVNPETLESRLVPGLFFCGEILDVDGDCGGFNLQWAWSSGWLAGSSAAQERGRTAATLLIAMLRLHEIKLALDHDENALKGAVLSRLGIGTDELIGFRVFRQAVDARKKAALHLVYAVDATVKNEERILRRRRTPAIVPTPDLTYPTLTPGRESLNLPPVVVGSGPAGLFAALLLARQGYRPLVLERGKPVEERCRDVEFFWSGGGLDVDSNLHFGEGGAGTFSDGKLTTLIHDPRCRKVLEEFVAAGAEADILCLNKPHLGSDRLPAIVRRIRQTIVELGGEVRFQSRVTNLLIKDKKMAGVDVAGQGIMEAEAVILAPGNSARDTFVMLMERGVTLQAKPFSIGVRIEHPQVMIDEAQYGAFAGHPRLGRADYKMFYHGPDGRSAYTFCMCPGGRVVAAATEAGGLATNGVSLFARDGANANSALLVGVTPADFGSDHPLAGVEFQRNWERKAFTLGGGNYFAPLQWVGDFLAAGPSTMPGKIEPTYRPGWRLAQLADCLPDYVTETLRQALPFFAKRLPGFDRPDAVLTGVETRSSSPLRIVRNDAFESSIGGLYPAGEGAGYAGGIMSSAVDGMRAAEAIVRKYACP